VNAPFDPKVREYLAAPRYAVLATLNPNGSPHLTEMWWGIRGDEVFFNTTEERHKKRNLERDRRVSLLVAGKVGEPVWRSLAYVRLDGLARRVAAGMEALEDIVQLSIRFDGPASEPTAREHFGKMHRVTYVIDVDRVYAKGI
jgi:PPOX class probable F420-dependent enzyme